MPRQLLQKVILGCMRPPRTVELSLLRALSICDTGRRMAGTSTGNSPNVVHRRSRNFLHSVLMLLNEQVWWSTGRLAFIDDNHAGLEHQFGFQHVPIAFQRIAVQKNNVGEFAWLQRSELV